MKENVLDILIYLFENHLESDGPEADQETLQDELAEAGFEPQQIHKAFCWLEGLSDLEGISPSLPKRPGQATRIFSSYECSRLDLSCQGFLISMEAFGILDAISRELVLDRIMALESDEIELDQVKWIVMLVLYNRPGQEAEFAWMENIVFQENESAVH